MSPTAISEQSCFFIADPSEKDLQFFVSDFRKFANLDRTANITKISRYFNAYHIGRDRSLRMFIP
ncbi:MAG: hypothetical protein COA78_37850 [Blastopirellula sp.]|nr:MAG: hypothetical protein COA78_37850 [Blastopirellula sp.]